MTARIYLLQDNGTLQSLTEQPYASEVLLQKLLVDYPDLLAGDQMDESAPRRWLLVSREVGVPVEEGGGDHMSLDHLFLDQDAIPTLVEVKRSSDTRIRREVVGQMLDYAAHAVAYWSAGTIRAKFEARCQGEGLDPVQAMAEFLETEDPAEVEGFWGQVKTNLQAGRIRLVFVADEIPPELRRVVEFLNRFTDPIEVLAVEIPQYVGRGLKTLVPRLIGQTTETQTRKGGGAKRRQWDEPSFFEELERREGAVAVEVAHRILSWARAHVTQIWWGQGSRSGSFVPIDRHKGADHQLFAVWTGGAVEIYFYWYQYKEPFASEERRREVYERLNAIARRPSIPLEALKGEALARFLEVFEWMLEQIRAS